MWPHRYAKNVKKPLGLSRVLEIYDRFLLSLGTPDITFEHPIQNGAPENLASWIKIYTIFDGGHQNMRGFQGYGRLEFLK